jgi:hypothetical protein
MCAGTVVRRAFEKSREKEAVGGCGGRGPYANSIEGISPDDLRGPIHVNRKCELI